MVLVMAGAVTVVTEGCGESLGSGSRLGEGLCDTVSQWRCGEVLWGSGVGRGCREVLWEGGFCDTMSQLSCGAMGCVTGRWGDWEWGGWKQELVRTKYLCYCCSIYKLDGVGPIDNRPSTD